MNPADFLILRIKYPIGPVVLPDFDMHGFAFPFVSGPVVRGDVRDAVWLSTPGVRSFTASPGVRGWLAEPND
jgi:hypothetical protein